MEPKKAQKGVFLCTPKKGLKMALYLSNILLDSFEPLFFTFFTPSQGWMGDFITGVGLGRNWNYDRGGESPPQALKKACFATQLYNHLELSKTRIKHVPKETGNLGLFSHSFS